MIFISNLLSSMLYSSIMTSSPMVKAVMVVATLPSISSDFIATMSVPSPQDNLAAADPMSGHPLPHCKMPDRAEVLAGDDDGVGAHVPILLSVTSLYLSLLVLLGRNTHSLLTRLQHTA